MVVAGSMREGMRADHGVDVGVGLAQVGTEMTHGDTVPPADRDIGCVEARDDVGRHLEQDARGMGRAFRDRTARRTRASDPSCAGAHAGTAHPRSRRRGACRSAHGVDRLTWLRKRATPVARDHDGNQRLTLEHHTQLRHDAMNGVALFQAP